ncbi:hypothetical protein FRC07_001215 [Ceratobasidium sp. 392]|nr:hypothetical protein FRC07_001215 [Ceratobasidium sp. 392]
MPRVCALEFDLSMTSGKMLSSVMECWIKCESTLPGKTLQLVNVRQASAFVLKPASCGSVSTKAFNAFIQTFKRMCLVNSYVSPAIRSNTLVELHLEDLNGRKGLTQKQLAAMMAASPTLRILALANCWIEPSKNTPSPATLNCLQYLSLESSEDASSCFQYVFPLLAIESSALNMSLTLDDDPNFIIAANSFFSRTRVSLLRVRGSEYESLDLFLFPMPHIETLVVEWCKISGPHFQRLLSADAESSGGTPWPRLRVLYLINIQVDAHSLRDLVLLHSLNSLYVYDPMPLDSLEEMTDEECRQLEALMPTVEDFKIYNGWDNCVVDNWDFIILE